MNNLETKQEAIKKAYGGYWETVKDYVDGNGWIKCKDIHYHKDLGLMRDQIHYIDNGKEWDNFEIISWRIPILQGIENNNGWIKIQSEADLPKERMHEVILLDEECMEGYRNYDVIVFYEVNSRFRKKEISHYKPIEKSKLPIY